MTMITIEEEDMMDSPTQDLLQPRFRSHGSGRPSNTSSGDKQLFSNDIEQNTLLGQFSFAPATQTTIVTTTTTTTTKFPPFLMRPPRRMQELDLKHYPLAASSTPAHLRNIHFEMGGKSTVFREAEDTTLALEQVRGGKYTLTSTLLQDTDIRQLEAERQSLRHANGTLQTVQRSLPCPIVSDEPIPSAPPLQSRPHRRPASPESITDNEDILANPASFTSHFPAPSPRTDPRWGQDLRRSHLHTQDAPVLNPITPDSLQRPLTGNRRRTSRDVSTVTRNSLALLPSPSTEQLSTFAPAQSSTPKSTEHQTPATEGTLNLPMSGTIAGRASFGDSSQDLVVPTPPIDDIPESSSGRSTSWRALSSVPARLHVADSPSINDGSLPSPSLSPVTAAATLQNPGYFADIDSSSDVASQHEVASSLTPVERRSSDAFSAPSNLESIFFRRSQAQSLTFSRSSVTEIPAMLDYFEAIPDELKSYVMHQLLRRCPKPTLQIVADAVNPALKCDFLSVLPPELALTVLKYLDVRSLTRAAQVSKKWRQMINGDERAWKELFDADGFTLPEGELQQAITEGWGWQDPYGPEGFEQNLCNANNVRSETEANSSSPSASQTKGFTGLLRRSKRKAATMLSGRTKQVKRKGSSSENPLDVMSIDWMGQMSTAEGPYNAANAAILAVPYPNIGFPSLKGLHLYKSLYRRHHVIRKNWMFEETRPQHLAFRAHDTHVVTCLQFDTDKILTGSDDNNINVYETKTGILRAILTGHEGGVWALQYEGNTLVSGSTDRSVRVWNIQEARETQVFRGHTSTVRCLQIVSPVKVGETADGKPIMVPKQPLIISGSRDSTLRVWRLPKPEDPSFIQAENDNDADDCPFFVRTLTGHQHSVRAIAAYADTLVSGSYDCTVRVWKISTGETIHRLQGHTAKVYSVVLDHKRNRCISGSMDNMVRIWDLNTGSLKYTLEGHTSLVGLLDLSCDKLVSAAADSTLRIWDPENGQCKATLSAHTGAITCFKHDGQKVISGSDRTLKLWNIKTGECTKDLLSDLSGVWQVKFNERRCVAAVQRDGLTYIEVS